MMIEGLRQILGEHRVPRDAARRWLTEYRYGNADDGRSSSPWPSGSRREKAGFEASNLAKLDTYFQQWLLRRRQAGADADDVLPEHDGAGRAGRRHGAGDAVADAGRAGDVRRLHAGRRRRPTTASTTATVISTAGDATLTSSTRARRAGPPGQRRVRAARAAAGQGQRGARRRAGQRHAADLLTYSGPVSNDAVTIDFKQTSRHRAAAHGHLLQDAHLHAEHRRSADS